MPFTATVAIGYAAPDEVAAAPAAEVAESTADVALATREDKLPDALERAEDSDSEAELRAELADSVAAERDSLTPLEKMVVLPTVLVMVLPSVVMVETTSDVVIAPAWSGQSIFKREGRGWGQLTAESVAVALVEEVSELRAAGSVTVGEAVTALVAAPGLGKVPDAVGKSVSSCWEEGGSCETNKLQVRRSTVQHIE